jgi:hypothetical protein
MEKKLDSILRQLVRGVIRMAKSNGWDKADFTCLLHDLWGEED